MSRTVPAGSCVYRDGASESSDDCSSLSHVRCSLCSRADSAAYRAALSLPPPSPGAAPASASERSSACSAALSWLWPQRAGASLLRAVPLPWAAPLLPSPRAATGTSAAAAGAAATTAVLRLP